MEGLDRAVVLGAQAFAALFPLLIVYTALIDVGTSGFVERLVERLELTGAAAEDLREAFAPPDEVEDSVTTAGAIVLIVSALTFTRAMQRLYERAWRLEPRGLKATGWGLLWLAGLTVFLTARQAVDHALTGPLDVIAAIAMGTLLWLATPFVLLARRESFRALLPSALLTAASMTVFSVALVLTAPLTFSNTASAYGVIGVAFAVIGWLIAAGIVVMLAASLGAVIAELAGLRQRTAKPGQSA